MKLIRCDHCRRELAVEAEHLTMKDVTDYVPVTVGGHALTGGGGKTHDLCSACAREVTRWITTPVPQEGTS